MITTIQNYVMAKLNITYNYYHYYKNLIQYTFYQYKQRMP